MGNSRTVFGVASAHDASVVLDSPSLLARVFIPLCAPAPSIDPGSSQLFDQVVGVGRITGLGTRYSVFQPK